LRRFARPRCFLERATFLGLRRRSVVTIDVHGSLDRVKDASFPNARVVGHTARVGCMCLLSAHADDVPLLGVQGTSAVAGARDAGGGTSTADDGPTEAYVPRAPREGRPLPEDRDVFHRHARTLGTDWIAPPVAARVGLSLTPPTLCPQGGDSVSNGRCKGHGAVTRDPWPTRGERLFCPLGMPRPGLTTQARQRDPISLAVDGVLIAPLAPSPIAAP
jgi:hypothetical protein